MGRRKHGRTGGLRRTLENKPFPSALINKGLRAYIGLFAEMGAKP
ncbi:resolvase, partial [Vibrio kanaloae]